MTDTKKLSKLANSVMNDPIRLRQLCDRMMELMREDLRNQRDRDGYARRLR